MTLPVLYNDYEYKIEYDPVNNKERFFRRWVGPHSFITIPVASYVYTNANSIFVDRAAGDDSTGDGTTENPYKTIVKGANSCTATITKVIVKDAGLTFEDLSTLDNVYFEGVYAATGISAMYTLRSLGYTPSDLNTIYVSKDGDDGDAGTNAAPKLTVDAADAIASGKTVMILDSETYTVAARTMVADKWCAALGETPVIKFTQTTASITTVSAETTFADVDCGQAYNGDLATCILVNGNIVQAYVDETDSSKGKFVIYTPAGSVVKSATIFEAGATAYISVAPMVDGSFIICYCDEGDSNKGKYSTWTSTGTADVATAVFNNASTAYISVCCLPESDYIVIAWEDVGDSSKGKFIIYNFSFSSIKAETAFEAGATTKISIAPLSNDNFVISFADGGDSIKGKFVIYDYIGDVVVATTVFSETAISGYQTEVCVLSDDSFVIIYLLVSGADNTGNFCIYNSSGVSIKSGTLFESGDTWFFKASKFSNDNFIISYIVEGAPNTGYFSIYDSSGTCVLLKTVFHNDYTGPTSCGVFSNDTFFIAYIDDGNSDKGKFLYYTSVYWSPLTVSSAATINGILIDGDNLDFMSRVMKCSAKLTAQWSGFKNIKNDTFPTESWVIRSSAEIEILNCGVYDDGTGIYAAANLATCKYNLFYRNDAGYSLHIKGTAASLGDIDVQHNTFFGNYAGVQLEDNGGTNEVVKNNVFDNNANYDIYAETAMTTTYSVSTGIVHNCTLGTGCTKANPLFENEGANDPDDIDLTLKLRVLGDYSDSPAYQLADDSSPDQDAGAWDVVPVGEATTWTSALISKPRKAIDIDYEPVGATITKMKSGNFNTKMDALIEMYTFKHEGLSNAQFAKLLDIVTCGNSLIRFYGDPYTHPDDFIVCRLVYERMKGFSKTRRLSRSGRQDVQITFGRAYE